MKGPGTDAVGMLRWGLLRYRWLFLICLLLGAGLAPLLVSQRDAPTDAEAVVLATRLNIDLSALPRYGEAVFNDGTVARTVAAEFPELGSADSLIPSRISLGAEQDSIVFQVIGYDADPERAAAIANLAAEAFVDALNAPGSGVGTFEVQSTAEAPADAASPLRTIFAIPVGLLAGLLLALAVVSLLLVIRRPVVDGKDAEEATGIPALGTVTVPRTKQGELAPPDAFPGLIPVCRRLLSLPTPTIVLVSRRRDEGLRRQLAPALTAVLSRVRNVHLIGPGDQPRTFPLGPDRTDTDVPDRLTVVDSSDPLDLVHPPELTATVLVVREGVRSSALRDAVVDHLGGSAEARLLMVRQEGRLRRSPRRAAAPGATTGHRDVAVAEAR